PPSWSFFSVWASWPVAGLGVTASAAINKAGRHHHATAEELRIIAGLPSPAGSDRFPTNTAIDAPPYAYLERVVQTEAGRLQKFFADARGRSPCNRRGGRIDPEVPLTARRRSNERDRRSQEKSRRRARRADEACRRVSQEDRAGVRRLSQTPRRTAERSAI